MSKGTLSCRSSVRPRPDDKLVLRFFDQRGKLVDGYRLAFKPHELPDFPNSGKPARIAEQTGYLDEASAVRLLGPKVELAYDRTSGELFRALVEREVVLTAGPNLHLQKSKAPMAVYPVGSAGKIGMVYGPEDVPGDSVWHFGQADLQDGRQPGGAALEGKLRQRFRRRLRHPHGRRRRRRVPLRIHL